MDSRGCPVPGSEKTFEVDTVCIGYGLIPSVWLTGMLGCRHVYNPLVGGWVPYFDENMQTDQPGIFVAGDGAGIAGVLAAKMQGTIAGLHAAAHAGSISRDQAVQAALPELRRLESMDQFRRAMDRIYQVYPDLYANVTDDTIVCRCEGITAGEIRKRHPCGNDEPERHQKTDPQRDGLLPGHQLPAGHCRHAGAGVWRRSGRNQDGYNPSAGPSDSAKSADGRRIGGRLTPRMEL